MKHKSVAYSGALWRYCLYSGAGIDFGPKIKVAVEVL